MCITFAARAVERCGQAVFFMETGVLFREKGMFHPPAAGGTCQNPKNAIQ
jgi:hypothetical protein